MKNVKTLIKVKAVAIDSALNVVCDERVTFDADLPEYRTTGGVNVRGRQVTAPTIMWVKALDMLMEKIRIAGKGSITPVDSFAPIFEDILDFTLHKLN